MREGLDMELGLWSAGCDGPVMSTAISGREGWERTSF